MERVCSADESSNLLGSHLGPGVQGHQEHKRDKENRTQEIVKLSHIETCPYSTDDRAVHFTAADYHTVFASS